MKGQRKCGKNCEHGLSTEQQEYWENYQWEVYDIRTPEEWNTSIQTDTIVSISVYSVIDKPGTWIQGNGKWYYLDETNGDWIDNKGTQMIQEALKYVGNPYVYGGNSLTNGTDCSGYVKLISEQFGITTPRTVAAQYTSSRKISYSGLQPGNLVFYYSGGKVSHVAFYVGKISYNGRTYTNGIVHAANESQGICVGALYGTPYGYGTYWK